MFKALQFRILRILAASALWTNRLRQITAASGQRGPEYGPWVPLSSHKFLKILQLLSTDHWFTAGESNDEYKNSQLGMNCYLQLLSLYFQVKINV